MEWTLETKAEQEAIEFLLYLSAQHLGQIKLRQAIWVNGIKVEPGVYILKHVGPLPEHENPLTRHPKSDD
jgi:hypothetical protein